VRLPMSTRGRGIFFSFSFWSVNLLVCKMQRKMNALRSSKAKKQFVFKRAS
jgi:hypothetical protein